MTDLDWTENEDALNIRNIMVRHINKKKNSIFTIEMNVRLEQKKNFVSLVRASGPFRFAGIDGDIGTVQI
ncbi:hypothetical protein BLOT_000101, partial [Blomia tropicalis]